MFGVNYLSWSLIYLEALKTNITTLKNEIPSIEAGKNFKLK
jgi:hypothetical protein